MKLYRVATIEPEATHYLSPCETSPAPYRWHCAARDALTFTKSEAIAFANTCGRYMTAYSAKAAAAARRLRVVPARGGIETSYRFQPTAS